MSIWNIIPTNDLKEHIEDSTCPCHPRIKFENGEMIIVHNSWDGREFIEQLTEDINLN